MERKGAGFLLVVLIFGLCYWSWTVVDASRVNGLKQDNQSLTTENSELKSKVETLESQIQAATQPAKEEK